MDLPIPRRPTCEGDAGAVAVKERRPGGSVNLDELMAEATSDIQKVCESTSAQAYIGDRPRVEAKVLLDRLEHLPRRDLEQPQHLRRPGVMSVSQWHRYRRPSEAIGGHRRPSEAIGDHRRLEPERLRPPHLTNLLGTERAAEFAVGVHHLLRELCLVHGHLRRGRRGEAAWAVG